MKFPYFKLLKKSWQICWKYKILWFFGLFVPAGYTLPNFNLPSFEELEINENWSNAANSALSFERIDQALGFLNNHIILVFLVLVCLLFLIFIIQILSWLSKPALIKLVQKIETEGGNPTLKEGFESGQKYFFRYILSGWALWLPYLLLIIPLIIGTIVFLILLFRKPAFFLIFLFFMAIPLFFLALFSIPLSLITELVHRKVVMEEKKVHEAIIESFQMFTKEWQKLVFTWFLSSIVSFFFGLLVILTILPVALIFFSSSFFVYSLEVKNSSFAFFVLATSTFALLLMTILVLAKAVSGAFLTTYWTLIYPEIQKFNRELLQLTLPSEPSI